MRSSSKQRLVVALGVAGAMMAGAKSGAHAQGDAPQDRVVATVGTIEITAAELEQRLATTPPFQLATFGRTASEVRRSYLDDVIVPETLHYAAALERKLDEGDLVRDRIRGLLRQALENRMRGDAAKGDPVTDGDIRKYYDENVTRFQTPRRLKIWRILVSDKSLAAKIIEQTRAAKGDQGPKKWAELAREHSVDEATKQREGSLGFVQPDGTTNMPRVKVDPKLFDAAEKVKDGELVPEPVAEGDKWAIVWRRGGIAAVTRSLESEEGSIRQILTRTKLEATMRGLLEKLAREKVGEQNVALLEYVNVQNSGDVASRDKAGTVPRRPTRADPRPTRGERGNR